jgi:signal transduction histidine kinase
MQLLAPSAHRKQLELILDVQPELPERVQGDPSRFRQIIVNLVGNAIKFTNQGEVTVRASMDSEDKSSGQLHFAVSDTGIGFLRKSNRAFSKPSLRWTVQWRANSAEQGWASPSRLHLRK